MTKSQAKTVVSSLTANSPMIQVKPRRGRRMMKALKSSLCRIGENNNELHCCAYYNIVLVA